MSVSIDCTGKSMGLPSGSYWNQFYHLRFSLTLAVIAMVNGKEIRWEDGVLDKFSRERFCYLLYWYTMVPFSYSTTSAPRHSRYPTLSASLDAFISIKLICKNT
jgi:hypothetical protein